MRCAIALAFVLSGCVTCYDYATPEERSACFARERQQDIADEKPASREDRIFCNQKKREGIFQNNGECIAYLKNPAAYSCREKSGDKQAFDRCVFEYDHPAEARCEDEDKKRAGSYWTCMQIEATKSENEKDRVAARQAREQEAKAEKRRAIGEAIQNASSAPSQELDVRRKQQDRQKSKCVSRRGFGNTIETTCESD